MTANSPTTAGLGDIKILVVDDEPHQCAIMEEAIRGFGYQVATYTSPTKLLYDLGHSTVDIIVSDLSMPEMNGIELLQNVARVAPTISVIVVTAHGTIETAVDAMKKGAEDYIQKPVEFGALEVALKKVVSKRHLIRQNLQLRSENDALKRDIGIRYHILSSIGVSTAAKELVKNIERFLKKREPLLLLGEAGTGRRDLARMIHFNSPWAATSVLTFDCNEVPEELHEVQLFGDEGGVQNGVRVPSYSGIVEKAHLGTLVILNLTQLSRRSQARLMSVISNKHVQRVNGRDNYYADVRVIAALSPTELETMQNNRWDLFGVLGNNVLRVPSLKDRKEDIPLLALALAKQIGARYGKTFDKIDKSYAEALVNREYRGNFRELETVIEAAVVHAEEGVLTAPHGTR